MRSLLVAATLVASLPAVATAQDHKIRPVAAEAIQWGPAPAAVPKGAQMAVLAGDPGKPGPFVIRLKMPAGFKIPPHQHPSAEAVTIISGNFGFGMGEKFDESHAEKLGPGGFVDLPANMNHYAFAVSEVVVQINSAGPFAIKYANPADDPSKTQ